jgi:hypothetical protein
MSDDITRNYHGGHPRSEEANMRTRKTADMSRIVLLMKEHPRGLICDEAEKLLGMRHQTCSARFSEMKRDGLLLPTGERRKTSTGSNADVLALPRFAP